MSEPLFRFLSVQMLASFKQFYLLEQTDQPKTTPSNESTNDMHFERVNMFVRFFSSAEITHYAFTVKLLCLCDLCIQTLANFTDRIDEGNL